jgi:hypothetical protein
MSFYSIQPRTKSRVLHFPRPTQIMYTWPTQPALGSCKSSIRLSEARGVAWRGVVPPGRERGGGGSGGDKLVRHSQASQPITGWRRILREHPGRLAGWLGRSRRAAAAPRKGGGGGPGHGQADTSEHSQYKQNVKKGTCSCLEYSVFTECRSREQSGSRTNCNCNATRVQSGW